MSESNIALLTDVVQITCVVANGKGEDVVKAARGAGAAGAIIHSVRGVGIRERMGLLGIAIEAEKDVVEMLVGSDQAEMIAHTIYLSVELGRPGGGFIYLTPLESAATYLPKEIRNRLKDQDV
jgi:nitrogen regulatory protein P-II 1